MFNLDSLLGLKNKAVIDYFKKILPKNAVVHKEIIQRLCSHIQSENDLIKLASMINDVYAEGYSTALLHCKAKLEERGIKFNISSDENSNLQN